MAGDFVSSFHERIGRYEREETFVRGQLQSTNDPAHYLKGVQGIRDRTNQWNADRLRSGVRRVAGLSYGDTVPLPDPSNSIRLSPLADVVNTQREMRRYREANISRRRKPKDQPCLDSLQGQKIVIPAQEATPPVSLATPEEEPAQQVDLDILRRLLQTPSRILSKSTSPFASLSPGGISNGPDGHASGTVSAPPCPTPTISPSRLPPVRGRLLPMTLARGGSRHNLQDSLKTTKLPAIPNGARVWRQNGAAQLSRSHTDLQGFKIYQHLLGGDGRYGGGRRAVHMAPHNALNIAQVSGDGVPAPPVPEKTILPVPSFPITQLLAASDTTKTPRVDYISINIPLPMSDLSRSDTPTNAAFDVNGASFVPPPSPATQAAYDESECVDDID